MRKSIEVEVEVPGTPEEVWEAIATGPGITAWFVPAEVEGREGGTVSYDFGGGLEAAAVVTAWDPPHRFAGEEDWQPSETTPAARLATEFLVEARSGGTCLVRLVTTLSSSGGDWDRELESMDEGWQLYLNNLKLYLTHFPGRRCASIMVTGNASDSLEPTWVSMSEALGLADAAAGKRAVTAGAGAPALAGTVDRVIQAESHRGLTLRTDQPAPGYALVSVYAFREGVHPHFHAYLFGDDASSFAARDEPAWRAWIDAHFPSEATAEPTRE